MHIKFTLTIFKCTAQWCLVYSHCYVAVTTIHPHNFSSCKTETLYPLNNKTITLHSLLPQSLATSTILSVFMILTILSTLYEWNYTVIFFL